MKSPARTADEYGPRGLGAPWWRIRSMLISRAFCGAEDGAGRRHRRLVSARASAREPAWVWPGVDWARRSSAGLQRRVAARIPRPLLLAEPLPAQAAAARPADKIPRRVRPACLAPRAVPGEPRSCPARSSEIR